MKKTFLLLAATCIVGCSGSQIPKDTERMSLNGKVQSVTTAEHKGQQRFGEYVAGDRLDDVTQVYKFDKDGYITEFSETFDDVVRGFKQEIKGNEVHKATYGYTYHNDTTRSVFDGPNCVATYSGDRLVAEYTYNGDGKPEEMKMADIVARATHSGDTVTLTFYTSSGEDLRYSQRLLENRIVGGREDMRVSTSTTYPSRPYSITRDLEGLPLASVNAKISHNGEVRSQYVYAGDDDTADELRTYVYTYDEQGNWITRAQLYRGDCESITVRTITYY